MEMAKKIHLVQNEGSFFPVQFVQNSPVKMKQNQLSNTKVRMLLCHDIIDPSSLFSAYNCFLCVQNEEQNVTQKGSTSASATLD
jgi:hypothetical protein